MNRRTIRLLGVVGAVLLLALSGETPGFGQASTQTFQFRIPVDLDPDTAEDQTTVTTTCGGNTSIELSGYLHITIHATIDDTGNLLLTHIHNPQGVTGVGVPSGYQYQGVGVSRFTYTTRESGPFQMAFLNVFQLVGKGKAPSYRVHDMLYYSFHVHPDGTVEVHEEDIFLDRFVVECR